MASKTFEYSTTEKENLKTIKDCGFSEPTGHQFAYWTFTQNGTDKCDDPYLFTSNCNLYAKWSRKSYTVYSSATNCTLTCNSTGTFLEKLNISWNPLSESGTTYYFENIYIYSGKDATGEILYQNFNDDRSVDFTMTENFYENIYIKISYRTEDS